MENHNKPYGPGKHLLFLYPNILKMSCGYGSFYWINLNPFSSVVFAKANSYHKICFCRILNKWSFRYESQYFIILSNLPWTFSWAYRNVIMSQKSNYHYNIQWLGIEKCLIFFAICWNIITILFAETSRSFTD